MSENFLNLFKWILYSRIDPSISPSHLRPPQWLHSAVVNELSSKAFNISWLIYILSLSSVTGEFSAFHLINLSFLYCWTKFLFVSVPNGYWYERRCCVLIVFSLYYAVIVYVDIIHFHCSAFCSLITGNTVKGHVNI